MQQNLTWLEKPIIAVKIRKNVKNRMSLSKYNIAVEILANAIRHNSDIRGMLFRQVIESLFAIT